MRQLFTRLSLLALAALFTVPASAQQTISFNEAVSIALEQNVNLQRARNGVENSSISVDAARAAFLPNANLSASGGRNWGLTFDQTTLSLVTRSSDRFSSSVRSGVNLFNGFSDVASLEQARMNLEGQERSFERSEETVVFTVIQNYLQLILDLENIEIQTEDVEAQRQQLERIQEFVRVGTRPISDQYQQQALLASSEAQLLTAQRSAQLSESRLINTLQLDPLEEYVFEIPQAEDIPLTPRTYNADDLLRGAFQERSDLQAQEFAIRAAEQGIRIAKAGRLPRLDLSGSVSTSYSSLARDPLTGQQAGFGDQFDNNRSESVSLSMSVPVFNRFATKNSIQRAQIQLSNAALELDNIEQNVALDVRQAYLDYQTAVKRLDVTAAQFRAAEQALEVEQERYDVGASTLVELTQARSSYVNAVSQRVQAIYQFHFQHFLIDYYQGTLDPTQSLF